MSEVVTITIEVTDGIITGMEINNTGAREWTVDILERELKVKFPEGVQFKDFNKVWEELNK